MIRAERLAALHASAFDGAARWSATAFAAALADPRCFLSAKGAGPEGFVLGRTVTDEAELLTLVVESTHRRGGVGRALLSAFEAEAQARGAATAFLEVSADNRAALAMYAAAGWRPVGRRDGYYAGIDAVTMRKAL